ncbi:MAG: RagB/SusD family nutrient uptake outer membrane protein [Muribaculaceae bacterium]|nr:RagB/SusD family nutrient uptake outer membrane protein [Muribaculaceae bacterium]
MKKIFLSLIACAGLGLTSCDMNTTQFGVIDDSETLNYDYATNFRNYAVYSCIRTMTTGAWVYDADLQCDQFIGLSNNGGRGMNGFGDGFLTSSNGDVDGCYGGCYSRIAQVNYYIDAAQSLLNAGTLTADETTEVKRYLGEAYFARAYYYSWLQMHFCGNYDEATADQEGLGLCLVKVYNPDGNPSSYPGRSSMNETISFIEGDLEAAFTALKAYEDAGNTNFTKAGANYLSSYAVAALHARFALNIGKNAVAAQKADYVIGNANYSLATLQDYVDMWKDENVDELIFAPYVDQSESSTLASLCQGWNYYWATANQSDFIPTEDTVYSLAEYEDSEGYINDIRFVAFLNNTAINVANGTTKGYAFNKYPGVPGLSTGTNMYLNKPKPFRLSEMYLVKAEAAALTQDVAGANAALNTLVKARMIEPADFEDFDLVGNELIETIRSERGKELMGEGFRTMDLRRWKQGFDRNVPYDINPYIAEMRSPNGLNVKYAADDYRYVWPIPSSEMEINPQLKGQQNPGY